MIPTRLILSLTLACLAWPGLAALPSQIETIPDACGQLTEAVARGALQGEVRALESNEHIPVFYSQCEYMAPGRSRRALRFQFKFMVREMFDVDRLAPEQVDFNAGFVEGGLSHSERLQFPGELTYVFHERDTTMVLMLTGIDGPGETTLVASYRLIDGERTPMQRREILIRFPWKLLALLNNSQ